MISSWKYVKHEIPIINMNLRVERLSRKTFRGWDLYFNRNIHKGNILLFLLFNRFISVLTLLSCCFKFNNCNHCTSNVLNNINNVARILFGWKKCTANAIETQHTGSKRTQGWLVILQTRSSQKMTFHFSFFYLTPVYFVLPFLQQNWIDGTKQKKRERKIRTALIDVTSEIHLKKGNKQRKNIKKNDSITRVVPSGRNWNRAKPFPRQRRTLQTECIAWMKLNVWIVCYGSMVCL